MRRSIQWLITQRFAAVHAAQTTVEYPQYAAVADTRGPRAALGYRFAADGGLFLERYLDRPVEQCVGIALDRAIARDRIVEIGAHVSVQPRATVKLWARAEAELEDLADVAVAVLTAPMRAMFTRLGLPFHILAPAPASRLAGDEVRWGRYYDADPMVCAGLVAAARAPLSRWQSVAAQ